MKKEKNKRKSIILMAIGVLTLLIVVGGATYAYFQAQTGASKNVNINATTGTTDNLTFAVGQAIDIEANMSNFAQEGGSSQAGETTATATLTANSATNTTEEYTYNIYLQILQNDFDYSNYTKEADTKTFLTKEAKEDAISKKELDGYTPEPELYLTIIDPEGNEVEDIVGIGDYYSDEFPKDLKVEGTEKVGGYDITTLKAGVYALKSEYPIKVDATENGQEIDNWQIRVTFKWFEELDQQLNAGKKFQAKIIIQQEEILPLEIAQVDVDTPVYNTLVLTPYVNGGVPPYTYQLKVHATYCGPAPDEDFDETSNKVQIDNDQITIDIDHCAEPTITVIVKDSLMTIQEKILTGYRSNYSGPFVCEPCPELPPGL